MAAFAMRRAPTVSAVAEKEKGGGTCPTEGLETRDLGR